MTPRSERAVYGATLAELGQRYPDLLVLDADLARATETHLFRAAFPDRYFDLGIAEQNLVSVAAGVALSGRRVIVGSFACFMGRRAADQVAISVCYCRAPVVLAGIEPGLSSGRNGASHQAVEDLAIMQALPNMNVFVPADATEHRALLSFLMQSPMPAYIRVQRGDLPVLFEPETYTFQFGKAVVAREGADATIVTCGTMLQRALAAADDAAADGIHVRVLNIHTVKPLDAAAIAAAAEETGALVTAEDHSIHGGLGAAVAAIVGQTYPVPVIRVGIPDSFGEVGTTDYLAEKYGLSSAHIRQALARALEMKTQRRRL